MYFKIINTSVFCFCSISLQPRDSEAVDGSLDWEVQLTKELTGNLCNLLLVAPISIVNRTTKELLN